MQVHMVLGIFCKVALIAIYGHGFYGKPAVLWFPDMGQQRETTTLHEFQDGGKSRIIQEYKIPQAIPESHSNIFPDLEAYGPLIKTFPEFINHLLCPAWFFKMLHGEGGKPGNAFRETAIHLYGSILLLVNVKLTVGPGVDGQQLEFFGSCVLHDGRIPGPDMYMYINLGHLVIKLQFIRSARASQKKESRNKVI